MSDLPTVGQGEIICPYCGFYERDDLRPEEGIEDCDCSNCGKTFQLETSFTVTYCGTTFENIKNSIEESINYWKNSDHPFSKDVLEMLMTELFEINEKIKKSELRLESYRKSGLFLEEDVKNGNQNS